MHRFIVEHVGGWIDVYAATVTPAAQAILNDYLVTYYDASSALGEDLYKMEEFECAGIPEGIEGYDEVEELAALARQNNVAYCRLIDRPLGRQSTYSSQEWEKILQIVVLLSAKHFHSLLIGTTEIPAAGILRAWAMEFIDNYGVWPPDWRGVNGETFEQVVSHWGGQRLVKYYKEGK